MKSTNRIQQLNDMNEICYEKVSDQVRMGQQVISLCTFYDDEAFSLLKLLFNEIVHFLVQVMVFVHARNETVRTATVLSELAKNSGESRLFEPEQNPRYGDALKQVRTESM